MIREPAVGERFSQKFFRCSRIYATRMHFQLVRDTPILKLANPWTIKFKLESLVGAEKVRLEYVLDCVLENQQSFLIVQKEVAALNKEPEKEWYYVKAGSINFRQVTRKKLMNAGLLVLTVVGKDDVVLATQKKVVLVSSRNGELYRTCHE